MRRAIYPGSFDPITTGHIDIIQRAAKLVDELIVAVLVNPSKPSGLFKVEERLDLIEKATSYIPNIKVEYFEGLLVDFACQKEATIIIRGVRSSKDLEMEMGMAQINRVIGENIETILLMTDPKYSYISSSAVRELIRFGGEYSAFVPEVVNKKLSQNEMEGD